MRTGQSHKKQGRDQIRIWVRYGWSADCELNNNEKKHRGRRRRRSTYRDGNERRQQAAQ